MRETLACVGAVIAAFWLGHYSGSRRADPALPPQQQRHGRALAQATESQQIANNCSLEQARQAVVAVGMGEVRPDKQVAIHTAAPSSVAPKKRCRPPCEPSYGGLLKGDSDPVCAEAKDSMHPTSRTLIVYSHYEAESVNETDSSTPALVARFNLLFFLEEGVLGPAAPGPDEAHFVFVIAGRRLGVALPKRSNVERYDRDNHGMEFCGVAEVLKMMAKRAERFSFFIFLNSSVRGPFYPIFMRGTWTHGLTHRLDASTKLSGVSIGCGRSGFVHLQSFVLATDCVRLQVIIPALRCWHSKRDAIFGSEFPISRAIIGKGYNLASTMRFWYGHKFQHAAGTQAKCAELASRTSWHNTDVMYPGSYLLDGVDPNPMELMFVKTNRGKLNSTEVYTPLSGPLLAV